ARTRKRIGRSCLLRLGSENTKEKQREGDWTEGLHNDFHRGENFRDAKLPHRFAQIKPRVNHFCSRGPDLIPRYAPLIALVPHEHEANGWCGHSGVYIRRAVEWECPTRLRGEQSCPAECRPLTRLSLHSAPVCGRRNRPAHRLRNRLLSSHCR